MKITLLDGFNGPDSKESRVMDLILQEAHSAGAEVRTMTLRDMQIAHCLGCFACWMKTPGECAIKDDEIELLKAWITDDLMLFVTPVTFGSYSSQTKKGIDRLLPNVLPFFKKGPHGTDHLPRYSHYARLAVVGILDEPDKESEQIFLRTVSTLSENPSEERFPGVVTHISSSDDDIRKKVSAILCGGRCRHE
jgi:multimeric flavodoxin WrbA